MTNHLTEYKLVNRLVLLVMLVIGCAILVADCLGMPGCTLKQATGKDCVLCGCTRDFHSLISGTWTFINPASPYVFAVLFVEFCWRIFAGRREFRFKVMCADIVLHILFGLLIVVWNFSNLFENLIS